MTSPNRIRVLLVDDHVLFTEGLRELLSFHDDLEVVATAASAEEALAEVPRLLPDVVLMDLGLPGLDGVAATRRLTARSRTPAVLALTMYDDDSSLFAVVRAGARGYVLKGARQEELVAAIRAVARGEAVFGARVADRVLASVRSSSAADRLPELTDRERQVLGLLAGGRPTAEVAARLGVSSKTVRNHLSTIIAKLQVADRAEAVHRARDAGLVE